MYKTKTKELVYNIIKESENPISALEILKLLKSKNKDLHKTTIYRTLDKLLDMELINKVSSISGVVFYESLDEHHIHVECITCNTVECVNDQEIEKKLYEIESLIKLRGFKVEQEDFNFQGVCKSCN
ncbi:transcriptional repressor [bacterium]|jgi:Fur family transcriptional regulator, ferric uptake regulator|nr:transcriptional repressor [bacterium]MBT6294055.1 transcriptional repressor [bacterium]